MITTFFLFFFIIPSTSSSFALQLAINVHATQLGCAPNLSQNMFFTGTTTIPLSDVMHQNHQSVAMTQNRTPPTLFQYPSKSLSVLMAFPILCFAFFVDLK
jgi:hypothetical protein